MFRVGGVPVSKVGGADEGVAAALADGVEDLDKAIEVALGEGGTVGDPAAASLKIAQEIMTTCGQE